MTPEQIEKLEEMLDECEQTAVVYEIRAESSNKFRARVTALRAAIALAEERQEMGVVAEVAAERAKQKRKGFTSEHDDFHDKGELVVSAGAYLSAHSSIISYWPWSKHEFRSEGKRKDLLKAAALIVAEIERMDRAAANKAIGGGA
jgi:hypothetical protein